MPESTIPEAIQTNETLNPEANETSEHARPFSQVSNLSCSRHESVTTFIERTVTNLASPQLEQFIQESGQGYSETTKVFVSEPIVVVGEQPAGPKTIIAEEIQSQQTVGRSLPLF